MLNFLQQNSLLPMEYHPPMSLRGAFLARTLVTQEKARELLDHEAASGSNSRDLLASFNRDSLSWKTSQHCLVEGLETFSETWPRSGMMRNGIAYQRRQLAHCTTGAEFGLSLIPTPTASDHKGSGRLRLERGANNNLRDWFKIKFGFLYPPVAAVEYLMGFPEGWASLKPTEMPSSRRYRK
jgi:hypothetical protein